MWLATLLPLAQAAASWHACSHLAEHSSPRHEQSSSDTEVCDLCLAAVGIGDGGPAPAVPGFTALTLGQSTSVNVVVARWLSLPITGYSSRAPPLSLR